MAIAELFLAEEDSRVRCTGLWVQFGVIEIMDYLLN